MQNNPPDLILFDIILSKLNGIEFLNQLKDDESTAHIPVILMSGTMGDDETKSDGLAIGAV
ncbi:response regulator [Candidatus Latescibacterota bacterium]